LAVSTWILDGSSIECHEKKHQRSSLSDVQFESRVFGLEAIQISGAVENELFILDSFLQCVVNSQHKTRQLAQIRHFEPQKFCNE